MCHVSQLQNCFRRKNGTRTASATRGNWHDSISGNCRHTQQAHSQMGDMMGMMTTVPCCYFLRVETNVAYIPLWNALLGNMWLTRYVSVKSIILFIFFLRNPHLLVINEILKKSTLVGHWDFFLIQPLIYMVIAGLACRCFSLSEHIFKKFLLRSESIYTL